ncbi:MAG: NAD(P)/FAD-dependent oxidoreductase [Chromatiales bacterium]
MSIDGHANSYYAASANPAPAQPTLEEAVVCDVCVIGGGITGCSTALNLAERGYRVVLVESHCIGYGGSGRSGGQMIAGFARDMSEYRRLVSREDAQRLWDMSTEAVRITKSRIERHHIQCDLAMGQMHVAIKPRQHQELVDGKRELEEEYGYEGLRLLQGASLREMLDTDRYISGLFDTHGGHLHPLNYTLGLAAAARAAGAHIFEHSPALSLGLGDPATVRTPRGEVRCKHLVLACGAYIEELVPKLRRKIMPVGTYITATEPLGEERARSLIRNNMAITDINFVLDYFRLSADHRLLFGGRVSYSTFDPPALALTLRRRMTRVFPQLVNIKQDYTWGGFVDITLNRFPHFGRLRPDVYFAHGFSGHGMALTGLAGELLAEAIAGTAQRFDLFAKVKHHDFPGGKLMRTPLLVLAMLYFRLRDLL